MAKIIQTGIGLAERTLTGIILSLSATIQFTDGELAQAQDGEVTFELDCTVWDDDPFSNDKLDRRIAKLRGRDLQKTSPVEMQFALSRAKMRDSESSFETTIELFGEIKLRKNGRQVGPTGITRNLDFRYG